MRVTTTTLLVLAALAPLIYLADQYIHTQFVFSPPKLQELSRRAIAAHGNDTEALLRRLTLDLRSEYGDAVADWTREDWFFNNAGGAMGSLVVLHASISEYLIFFGTPLHTEGHSGVHTADDYFTVLVGEQHSARAGDLVPAVYGPGEQQHLRRGQTHQYAMPRGCWGLELAQGWIPPMLPFGFADTFSSTLDWGNLWKTVRITAGHMGRNLLRGKI